MKRKNFDLVECADCEFYEFCLLETEKKGVSVECTNM